MHILKGENNRIAKLWVDDLSNVESAALDQIRSMMLLPAVFKHIAIMPDCHVGFGATVGAVVATERVVVPNLVGVDIGCGMSAVSTGIPYDRQAMGREFWMTFKSHVDRSIPTGFSRHKAAQPMGELSEQDSPLSDDNLHRIQREIAPLQMGTLGGGNHFLEAQYDESDNLWLMVHSGSRHTGLQIANHYEKVARKMNERWHSQAPKDLAFLPTESVEGQSYWADMEWATDFALENRYRMLEQLIIAFDKAITKSELMWNTGLDPQQARKALNIHHNFANMEHHFGQNVVVHRKGATQARKGQLGIIPGSMGSASYIVEGLGHPDSYTSCSHGAGRRMSRTQAKREISTDAFHESLKHTYTKASGKLLDEAPGAYKDIDTVMANQTDLVRIVHTLRPIITIKGEGE